MIDQQGFTPNVITKMRELLTLGRIDFVVLVLVVFNMVVKPTSDDPGVLIAMAAVLVAGTAIILSQARALRSQDGTESAPASA